MRLGINNHGSMASGLSKGIWRPKCLVSNLAPPFNDETNLWMLFFLPELWFPHISEENNNDS